MYVQRKNRETDKNHGYVVILCCHFLRLCGFDCKRERESASSGFSTFGGGEGEISKKSLSNSTCLAEKSSRWILLPSLLFFGKILYYYFILIIRETVNFNLYGFVGNAKKCGI